MIIAFEAKNPTLYVNISRCKGNEALLNITKLVWNKKYGGFIPMLHLICVSPNNMPEWKVEPVIWNSLQSPLGLFFLQKEAIKIEQVWLLW